MTQEETDELINLFFNPTLKKENEDLKNRIHDLLIDNTEYKLENERLNNVINKAINNLEKSIKAINKKLENDKELKVENGIIINMNVYQKVRLKAFKTKCKELLNILKGEK